MLVTDGHLWLHPYNLFMITRAVIIQFFTKGKVIFATVAAVITFCITLYNQFKSGRTTEISGLVAVDRSQATPVDAIVRISSPIQAQTETDAHGRFKFKLDNLQTDTFLIIVQNKRTNVAVKQNEYVNASSGRRDIIVLFDSTMRSARIYGASDTGRLHRAAPPNIKKVLRNLFH
jgi:hypothetical protein